jgi:hypothetical protein
MQDYQASIVVSEMAFEMLALCRAVIDTAAKKDV